MEDYLTLKTSNDEWSPCHRLGSPASPVTHLFLELHFRKTKQLERLKLYPREHEKTFMYTSNHFWITSSECVVFATIWGCKLICTCCCWIGAKNRSGLSHFNFFRQVLVIIYLVDLHTGSRQKRLSCWQLLNNVGDVDIVIFAWNVRHFCQNISPLRCSVEQQS